ncbi:MAG: hypothetical protein ACLSID_00110 [Lactococcus lactis]
MEKERILLASPHMSDKGYEQEFVKGLTLTGLLLKAQMKWVRAGISFVCKLDSSCISSGFCYPHGSESGGGWTR